MYFKYKNRKSDMMMSLALQIVSAIEILVAAVFVYFSVKEKRPALALCGLVLLALGIIGLI